MSKTGIVTVTINYGCSECSLTHSWVSVDGQMPHHGQVLMDCKHRRIKVNGNIIVTEIKPQRTWCDRLENYMRKACIYPDDIDYVLRYVDEHAHEWKNLAT